MTTSNEPGARVGPSDAELPFDRLGDYDVVAPIAEGGMASVWLARRTGVHAEFAALKVIRPEHARNKEFVAMLVDEAKIASRLAHPNILATRAFGVHAGTPFLVMELLRGRTLLETSKAMHARGKRFPLEVVAWIGARIADALHYAHELMDDENVPLNIVHRDVNHANVFLTSEGSPKLIDFGLAKARDRIASTAIGVVKGKLAYLAPEQAHGHPADRRSDVFALGVTLWELSLDRRLFLDESDVQTVRRVREAEVPDPRTIDESYPVELAEALLRALAKEPDRRFQSAADLRDSLDAFVKGVRPSVGAADVRALLAESFAGVAPAPWERPVDEATAEQASTRIWKEPEEPAPPEAAARATPVRTEPLPVIPAAPRDVPPPAVTPRVPRLELLAAAAVAVLGAVVGGLIVRGWGRDTRPGIDRRVDRIEELLGLSDAGPSAAGSAATAPGAGAVVAADDRSGACAVATIASYRAWQDALAKARLNAQPAEAACADIWSDTRKQACYRAATAQIRATQAARDAAIAGGAAARDAVRAVKDDAKNEAVAHARGASASAFEACGDDAGP